MGGGLSVAMVDLMVGISDYSIDCGVDCGLDSRGDPGGFRNTTGRV
jgi:hypothetical protein